MPSLVSSSFTTFERNASIVVSFSFSFSSDDDSSSSSSSASENASSSSNRLFSNSFALAPPPPPPPDAAAFGERDLGVFRDVVPFFFSFIFLSVSLSLSLSLSLSYIDTKDFCKFVTRKSVEVFKVLQVRVLYWSTEFGSHIWGEKRRRAT